jgi:hypothetical protein
LLDDCKGVLGGLGVKVLLVYNIFSHAAKLARPFIVLAKFLNQVTKGALF